ncbi:metal-dependent hydrolase [Roseivivax sp. CAU 1753]
MKLTFLGHASFRIEAADAVILLDPWLAGNPVFPDARRAEALEGVTHILLTHAHFDHADEVLEIAREASVPVAAIADLATYLGDQGLETIGFNKGGTIDLGGARITMVHATHSSTFKTDAGPVAAGSECGFMIAADGHTLYVSGDTDVMADMKIFNDLHAPDAAILCAGGHFTMDMERAAYAARTFFDFKMVIPCHYKTFPLLEQSAEALRAGLPDTRVIEPEVLVPIEL